MATPETTVDGTTVFRAADMNKYLTADGSKLAAKMWWARIFYNGVSTVIDGTMDTSGIVTAVFNGGNTEVDVTLAGFTNTPQVIVVPTLVSSAYYVKPVTITNVLASIAFYDIDTGAKIVTGVEDTDMSFTIQVMGT
jgi:hypothetical protein